MPTTPAPTSDHRHHAAGDNQKPNPILHSLLIKPVIFLFVLSLFLFLGLAALSLLFLLLAGSSLHLFHRRRTTAASNSITPSEIEENLPGFRSDPRSDPVKECAVCLEWFKEGEDCRKLVDCNHVFHSKCVDSWLVKVLNCPICRGPVKFDSVGSGSFENGEYKMWWPVGV